METELQIIHDDSPPSRPRRAGIFAWCEYGYAVLDCRGSGPHKVEDQHPSLSPEDREAKWRAEEYVSKHLRH